MRWKTSEKPSMRFSKIGSSASGVTSRPVKPVPPVVMITSIAASFDHDSTRSRILSVSSVTMSRAASLWPAASMRSASVCAGFVVGERARVGDGQHGDADRDERPAFVKTRHRPALLRFALPPRTSRDGWRRICVCRFAARAASSNRPKQVAPDPDMRAKRAPASPSARQRVADLGRERPGRRLQIVAGFVRAIR